MGGPIAQQLASSLILRAADKAVASSIEYNEKAQQEAQNNLPLPDRMPDDYWATFVTSGFTPITPLTEPLPSAQVEQAIPEMSPQVSRLVKVELWNLLLGDEKQSVLEKARLMGDPTIPPKTEWPHWKVATGSIENEARPMIFLIPPQFGKVSSGQYAVVEMTGSGELHVARYPAN